MHIAIAGNIGAGKTSLAELLAQHLKWELLLESVDQNPYLNDFYQDMERWSFNLQVYFLGNRFEQIKNIREKGKNFIQDRTIFEDAFIFAANLNNMGLLSSRDYDNYLSVFGLMNSLIESPDLLIYLKSSVPNLIENIHKRGREYENSISEDYLLRLNEKYDNWIQTYDQSHVIEIEVDNIDFLESKEDFQKILEQVQEKIQKIKQDSQKIEISKKTKK